MMYKSSGQLYHSHKKSLSVSYDYDYIYHQFKKYHAKKKKENK